MRILGIDPGTATTGFGVIDTDSLGQYSLVDFGLVTTSKSLPPGHRLDLIYQGISTVITKHSPDVVSLERLFFAANALTAIAVGQAIGVIKLAIHHHQLPVFEYTPMQVKLHVAGTGKADKTLMKKVVKKVLKISKKTIRVKNRNQTHFDDSADAIALAICHIKQTQRPKV